MQLKDPIKHKHTDTRRKLSPVAIALIIAAAAVVVIFGIMFFVFRTHPSFSVQNVTIVAGDEFDPKSIISDLKNVDIDDIEISGEVDTSVPGTYTLTYSYKNVKKEARVEVTGAALPEFTLKSAEVKIAPGDTLKAEDLVILKDPNAKVKITLDTKNADFTKVGTYRVNVIVTNEDGRSLKKTMRVVVAEPEPETEPEPEYAEPVNAEGPYLVKVNRALCTVTVYTQGESGEFDVPVTAFPCSVGREGMETPLGTFTTSDRLDWGWMADGTFARYFIRIDGDILFHSVPYWSMDISNLEYTEFNKLGSPASMGCIRLCVADAYWLYCNCQYGFTTIIYDDYESPGPLGKPASAGEIYGFDENDPVRRGWDPTDWDPNNPWHW